MTEQRLYRLGPRERRGLIAGWRPGQVLSAALGCGLAAGSVAFSSSPLALTLAIFWLSAGIACATVPVRGRTLEEWVPVVFHFVRARGEHAFACGEVESGSSGDGLFLSGRLVIVLELYARGIALLDSRETLRLVEGFTSALTALAREGSVVDRASWTVQTRSDDAEWLLRDLRRRGRGECEAARRSYRHFLASVRGTLPQRSVYLALRARPQKGTRHRQLELLIEEAQTLAQALEDAGHPRPHLLDGEELHRFFRANDILFEDERQGVLATEAHFNHLATDEQFIVSWWIAQWPSFDVTAELLSSLILGHEGRSVSIVVEPVAPSVALRRAQVARTSGAADDEVRRRGGFLTDRRREREVQHLERREGELIDGHSSLRFAGYASVKAESSEALAERVAATELAAAQIGIRLQRCQGDHLRGFAATLPLCGGLP